jgi:hypothetical protein
MPRGIAVFDAYVLAIVLLFIAGAALTWLLEPVIASKGLYRVGIVKLSTGTWIWWRNNVPAVQAIYARQMKQTSAKRIADRLYKYGDIKNKINVNVEFDRSFNAQTVPTY